MCNLSEGIERRGELRGRKLGEEVGEKRGELRGRKIGEKIGPALYNFYAASEVDEASLHKA